MNVTQSLIQLLRTRPNLPSGDVLAALGVSRATLMRAVRAAGSEVLTIGRARRTRYAARRRLRGDATPLPVFRIDQQGKSHQMGVLHLAYPDGTVCELSDDSAWPLDEPMRDGWFEGLPYFLQDLRPDGFLGLQFARAYGPRLQLGDDPRQWSDDDALYALSLLGADSTGDLIVGETAFRLWLDQLQQPQAALLEAQVSAAYVERAQQALQAGTIGSSAGGEFPKFTALREIEGRATHVLVKFSGSDDSPGTHRWSDLLVCEHLAAQTLASVPGLAAETTRVMKFGNRTFFEAVRFDRHGRHGRSALCSWAAFNYGWFGLAGRPWTEAAAKLLERQLIDDDTAAAIKRLWYFGQLIGNTDMHDGNLSFRPALVAGVRSLSMAPAYDMLPMIYAPQRGIELQPVNFAPRLPLPADRDAWRDAARAASAFWSLTADDQRISTPFRTIAAANRKTVSDTAALLT